MAQYDVDQVVRAAVADTLGVPDLDAAALDSSLVDDLGCESLDLVDILFRIERALERAGQAVRLPLDWFSELLQGAVRDEDFCTENGVVTDSGLERLAAHLPQLRSGRWSGRLRVEHIPSLVTVRNLIDLVRARVCTTEAGSRV
jgi:acyl carrier protein